MSTTKSIPKKSKKAEIKMTEALYELIEQRAVRSGVRPATWMRSILYQAATSKAKNDGYIRIREPNGATA